ncbi:nuclear transport factor 2 [Hysterangium stoloniferum]|nr:nuclear transport factor 2 [Hysterangium stoloniferum]
MASVSDIATQFAQYYYGLMDTDKSKLATLFRPQSMLTWQDELLPTGEEAIMKLQTLPFTKTVHKIGNISAQPASPTSPADIIVQVIGTITVDDNTLGLQFSQLFHLIKEGDTYYIFNNIFHLVTV